MTNISTEVYGCLTKNERSRNKRDKSIVSHSCCKFLNNAADNSTELLASAQKIVIKNTLQILTINYTAD